MNRLRVALLAAVLPVLALAGFKVTEIHEGYQLTVGTKVYASKDATKQWTYDDCKAAMVALGAGAGKCKDSTSITVVATCDDVPQPVMPTIVNAEGFIVRPGTVVAALPDGSWGPTMQEGFVHGPDWAKGTPPCWVLGLVPYKAEVPAPDGPADLAPGPFVYGVDPEWPIGGKCPSNDPRLCYVPPNPPIPPAP